MLGEGKERATRHFLFQPAGEGSWAVVAMAQRTEIFVMVLSATATERQSRLAVLTAQ